MTEPEIPSARDLMYPVLLAMQRLGRSATKAELEQASLDVAGVTDEQLAIEFPPSARQSGPKVVYNLGWTRTFLKALGALDNSQRGVWTLAAASSAYLALPQDEAIEALLRDHKAERKEWRKSRKSRHQPKRKQDAEPVEEETWQEELLSLLKKMPPDAFERLTQRLLRQEGFVNVEITPSGPDGGIDGFGLYKASLISFPIKFQCKRYSGSVGAGPVRELRGILGGDERGLLITTGAFTRDARRAATLGGMTLIDLIDGEELCDLLKKRELGVKVEVVEDVTVQPEFFESI